MTTRREFLKLTAGVTISSTMWGPVTRGREDNQSTSSDRPNILWNSLEDISPETGRYG